MYLLGLLCRCTSACPKKTFVSDFHTNILHAFLTSPKPVHATSYLFSLIFHLSLCGSHSSELSSFSASQENPLILWNPKFHYHVYNSVEEQTVNHNKTFYFFGVLVYFTTWGFQFVHFHKIHICTEYVGDETINIICCKKLRDLIFCIK
jgi:hypothetical protein